MTLLPSDLFRAEEHCLRTLLADGSKIFKIPEYQRNFAWRENELQQLWEDLRNTTNKSYVGANALPNAQPHFFGAIVLTETAPDEYEVTDGQQRLTASTILLSCIKSRIAEIQDPQKQSGLSSLIEPVLQANTYGEPFRKRLELDDSVDRFFEEYVFKMDPKHRSGHLLSHPIRENTANSRIRDAVSFFDRVIAEELEDVRPSQVHDYFLALTMALTRLFMVLKIVVKKKETAYVIFETLNKRGRDLSESDMIKNELFKSVTSSKHHIVKASWDDIVSNIENEDLTEYIRFHYASSVENVRPSNLFAEIKGHIEHNDPVQYLTQLHSESEWYARLRLIGAAHWNEQITEKLKAFQSIDVSHSIPLLLASAAKYGTEDKQFLNIATATLTFCFRYFTIGQASVGDLEREIGILARALRNGSMTIETVIKRMHDLTPDQTFERKFKDFSTGSTNVAFYILHEFERELTSGVIPLPHGPGQHVEHIMPKTPSRAKSRQHEWMQVRNDPNYKEYIGRIGNLLILESDRNQKAKNKDFDTKRGIYETSGLYLPKEVAARYASWDFTTIEKRQAKMAQLAVKLWSYL